MATICGKKTYKPNTEAALSTETEGKKMPWTSLCDVKQQIPVGHRRFGGAYCLNHQDRRVSRGSKHKDTMIAASFSLVVRLAYSSILKMEAVSYIEMMMFYRIIWRHIPQDSTVRTHYGEDLKSNTALILNIPRCN
jgi:hypothetical protein